MNTVKAIIEYHVAPVLIESGEDSTIRIIDKEFDISSAPWTPEEVAVLVGMSDEELDKIGKEYHGHICHELSASDTMQAYDRIKPFSQYLRSHIQAEIKRQEASK